MSRTALLRPMGTAKENKQKILNRKIKASHNMMLQMSHQLDALYHPRSSSASVAEEAHPFPCHESSSNKIAMGVQLCGSHSASALTTLMGHLELSQLENLEHSGTPRSTHQASSNAGSKMHPTTPFGPPTSLHNMCYSLGQSVMYPTNNTLWKSNTACCSLPRATTTGNNDYSHTARWTDNE